MAIHQTQQIWSRKAHIQLSKDTGARFTQILKTLLQTSVPKKAIKTNRIQTLKFRRNLQKDFWKTKKNLQINLINLGKSYEFETNQLAKTVKILSMTLWGTENLCKSGLEGKSTIATGHRLQWLDIINTWRQCRPTHVRGTQMSAHGPQSRSSICLRWTTAVTNLCEISVYQNDQNNHHDVTNDQTKLLLRKQ